MNSLAGTTGLSEPCKSLLADTESLTVTGGSIQVNVFVNWLTRSSAFIDYLLAINHQMIKLDLSVV